MEREKLLNFAEVIYIKKEENRDDLSAKETEFNKLYLWLMIEMLAAIESSKVSKAKFIKSFEIKEKEEISIVANGSEYISTYNATSGIKKAVFYAALSDVLDFIEDEVENFEILNRYPRHGERIKSFMIKVE